MLEILDKNICSIYTGSVKGRPLHNPLSQWTQHYKMYWFWRWQLSPSGCLMYQEGPTSNLRIAILLQTHQRQLKFSPTIPMSQLFEGSPVTPTNPHHCYINPLVTSLPVTKLSAACPSWPEVIPQTSLIQQFCTMLEPWQWPLLFGPICKLWLTNHLLYANQNQDTATIVSDASVKNSKQSGFAWVISHQNQVVWHGVGLATGHADDMYSGRAKVFRLLAALTFLQYYSSMLWKPPIHHLPTPLLLWQF